MNQKTINIMFLVGLVVLLLSLTVDLIGIGPSPGFGPVQISGTIVGVIVIAVALYFKQKK